MKAIHVLILMMLVYLPAQAGFREKPPIRYGKVSKAEFSINSFRNDTTMPAIVLCDFGSIEISNRTFYTRHTRIKIINEKGFKYATVEIPYQTRNRHDDIMELKASTFNLENGNIITYKVPLGQMEVRKINDNWSVRRFTFPNVKPGAILEYKYTIASLDFERLDDWYFQREIPTLWSEIRFVVPPPFFYLVTFRNNRQLSSFEDLEYAKKLQWLFDSKPRARRNELARNDRLLFATSENRFKVWVLNNTKKKIVMKNLPGLSGKIEGLRPADYYPQVRFTLFESSGNLPREFRPLLITTSDEYDTRSQWELYYDPMTVAGYIHFRLKTWSEMNDMLLNNERFGLYLVRNTSSNTLIDSILTGCRTEADKIRAIVQFVRKSFKWNGEYSMLAQQDFKDFLRKRAGSSAEINLFLVNMLQRGGIKADPLLIRTSDLGMPEKMYPVRGEFNHVIALAEVDGVQCMLDATGGPADIYMLNPLDIGTTGWIVRDHDPGWIEIFSPANKTGKSEETPPVFQF
jgi:hypothetical protein